jgi:hypothetical protein
MPRNLETDWPPVQDLKRKARDSVHSDILSPQKRVILSQIAHLGTILSMSEKSQAVRFL